MSEKEYNFFRGIMGVGYKVSRIAALTGLAGMVASVALAANGAPENSELASKISSYSLPLLFGGSLFSAYFGLNYHANPPIQKNSQ
jgi:hypothetical protein